jgi:hypothetical protein
VDKTVLEIFRNSLDQKGAGVDTPPVRLVETIWTVFREGSTPRSRELLGLLNRDLEWVVEKHPVCATAVPARRRLKERGFLTYPAR